jgi:hypothetical protein
MSPSWLALLLFPVAIVTGSGGGQGGAKGHGAVPSVLVHSSFSRHSTQIHTHTHKDMPKLGVAVHACNPSFLAVLEAKTGGS